jgi:hypothetical protein
MDIWKGAVVRGPTVETAGIAALAFGTSVIGYGGQFLRSAIQPTGKESQLSARRPDPVAVLTETEQLVRPRYYAPRALRSYLGWARPSSLGFEDSARSGTVRRS